MRIVQLTIHDVKRISAVDITPDGDLVVISGNNGQGKTSVLDAIWLALAGGKASPHTPNPIRDGQDSAEVTVDLGALRVTRTWTRTEDGDTTTRLRVFDADDRQLRSPQAVLDDLVGQITFDPLSFASAPSKAQREQLLRVVELPFDPEQLARDRQEIFDRRTEVGRQIKTLEGYLATTVKPSDDLPAEPTTLTSLVEQIDTMTRARSEHLERLFRRQGVADGIEKLEREITAARTVLARLDAEIAEVADGVPAEPEIAALRESLDTAEARNAQIAQAERWRTLSAELDAATATRDDLTTELEQIDLTKTDGVTNARMPIEGLGFDDDGVTYQGQPLAQASGAERLRVSVAIAMATNPRLRIIRITDGSLLDDDSMAALEQIASEHDYQVWIERVGRAQDGFVIVDGKVEP